LEFDHHLGSHKHVINIIMWFRDMGCYMQYIRFTSYQNNAVYHIHIMLGQLRIH
jgi:hypothetical protein